jgi:hypothetical protein
MFVALLAVFCLSSHYNTIIPIFIIKHSFLNKQCFYEISLACVSAKIFIDISFPIKCSPKSAFGLRSLPSWLC